jgi:hypothetical protein
MKAEGKETGGGTARGTMTSRLTALPGGGTQVVAEASVDLTGRIMQMGRGMIQGVSHQLFLQFVNRARAALEVVPAAAELAANGADAVRVAGTTGEEGAGSGGAPASRERKVVAAHGPHDDAIRVVPLLLAALRTAIVRFLRRLFGRGAEAQK